MNSPKVSWGHLGLSPVTIVWLYLWSQIGAAPNFSDYLLKVLQNHTVQACDGEQLPINCPPQSTISVLSAFYGRRIASQRLCPTAGNTTSESTNCMARTTVPKVFDECQEQRSCQLSVNSRVFGLDPCPGTTKYLIISYKCKPDGHKRKAVCENEKLRLHCKNHTILVIYSASFGRSPNGNVDCPSINSSAPDIECLSSTALRQLSMRCHGKPNCTVIANVLSFGNPCFPGVRKQLKVAYACAPKRLFEEASQESVKPFLISDYTHGLPEKVALYFVSGVSIGLVLILCTFGFHMAVLRDIRKLCSEPDDDNQGSEDGLTKIRDDDDDDSSDTSFRQLTRQYRTSDNIFSPQVAAVMIERVEQKEQGDNEMWLNKESSPYAIPNHNQHSR
ncbi:protein eva-1 homolog C isoform X2 [Callorhinchus milii]|nr:protein eva-1 homolog C isoform X2 [Callorhinchus milii]|eukprot:gi/632935406/ref/XP_007890000.1/ PREDICTED: protein eva-1 homolog C-like isoform X2 [Callorhinchus milii]